MRKVTYGGAISLDGYLAGPNEEIDWLRWTEDSAKISAETFKGVDTMLMGRKTFEAIGKPLPGRTSLVLTRDPTWQAKDVIAVRSVDEALTKIGNEPELCIVGGAEIYKLTLPITQRIHLTRIHANIPGDAVFPALDTSEWRETERVEHPADERHAYAMTFSTLERR